MTTQQEGQITATNEEQNSTKNRIGIPAILIAFAVIIVMAVGSFAWLYLGKNIEMDQTKGSLEYVQPYFESGTGTSADPYIIKTADQFYNFVWLQYIGAFNKSDDGTTITQVYFKLSDDIPDTGLDLSDYILPPCGTTTYPFVGNFDGNGKTITGVKVTSNVPADNVPDIAVNYKQNVDEIVGLFGVVGSLTTSTDPDDTEKSSGTIGSYTYSSQVNEIKDLNIVNAEIEASASKALIGIAAGYVNGTLSGVAISGDATKAAVTKSNVSAVGEMGVLKTDNYSDYTVIGYCTDAYKDTSTRVDVDIAEPTVTTFATPETDAGANWGGSIDMQKLHSRISTAYDDGSTSNFKYFASQDITINEATGTISVKKGESQTTTTANAYSNLYVRDERVTWNAYQPRQSDGVTEDTGGSYVLRNSNEQYGLMGRPTNLGSTVTVTRFLNEFIEAQYIKDGTNYLNIKSDGSDIDDSTVTKTAAYGRWAIEAVDGSNSKIYTQLSDGTLYYLTNNNGTLGVSTTEDSSWVYENGKIYSLLDSKAYYLYYSGNSWEITADTVYYITDSNGDYLNLADNGSIRVGTDKASATKWSYDATNLYVTSSIGTSKYYLYINVSDKTVAATNTSTPHMVYTEGEGLYNVDEDSAEVGKWETVGTVSESEFVTKTSYILDVDEIDENDTYAIVSINPGTGTNQAKILYCGGTSSSSTDQVNIGSLSDTNMNEKTTLTLNTNSQFPEATQTWVAVANGSGIALKSVTSTRFVNLANTTSSKVNLTTSMTNDGTSLTISGTNAKTVAYTTSGSYVSQTISSVPSDLTNYYYYNSGSNRYEKIVYLDKSNQQGWIRKYYTWSIATEYDGEYYDYSVQSYVSGGGTLSVFVYTSTPTTNYLVHDDKNYNQFYTSTSTSGNQLYFFKKVTTSEATKGVADTQYLDRFIAYAGTLNEGDYDADAWKYMQSMLSEANLVKSSIHTTETTIEIAKAEQIEVNQAAANLQEALLLLKADKYYVAYADMSTGWYAVSESEKSTATLAIMEEDFITTEEADPLQKTNTYKQLTGVPTYLPLKADSSNSPDTAATGNTGYINSANVKDPTSSSSYQSYSGDIRVSQYDMSNLKYSCADALGNSTLSNNGSTYKTGTTKLQILTRTYQTGGTFKVIKDNYNNNCSSKSSYFSSYTADTASNLGLKKYDDSRAELETILNSSGSYVYGMHFMDTVISKDATFVADTAVIGNKTYKNYEMPEACIDFNLSSKGYINFYAGSYYCNRGYENNSFFSLYEIDRVTPTDDDGNTVTDQGSAIKAIKEITQVYGKPDDTKTKYIYKYADGTYGDGDGVTTYSSVDGYTLMFDTEWIKNPGLTSSIYYSMFYYEIPMNKGEYALGSVEDKRGAYLVYLDIAANKARVQQQEVSELVTTTSSSYEYPKGVQLVESGSYASDTDSVATTVEASGSAVAATLTRSGNNVTASGVSGASYIGDGITLTQDGTTLTATPTHETVEKKYTVTDYQYHEARSENQWGVVKRTATQTTVDGVAGEQVNTIEGGSYEGDDPYDYLVIPTIWTSATKYHYIKPAGVDVSNTIGVTGISTTSGFVSYGTYTGTLDLTEDFPYLGEDPMDKTLKAGATSNTIGIVGTSTTQAGNTFKVTIDSLADKYGEQAAAYAAIVNGTTFTTTGYLMVTIAAAS